MSTLSATVNNVSYPVHIASGYTLVATLEMRDILTFTIIDSPGTAVFTRGLPVTFNDSVTGKQYDGYVQSDKPDNLSPDPTVTTILHTLTCMDHQYDVDKAPNENPYAGGWHAGDIATDMVVNNKLAQEGILIAAALHHDTSTSDFNTGTLSNTVGSTAIPSNDGDLELAKAGTDLTITEATTADFASGTLTNMTAANNTLSPSTVSGLSVSVNLPITLANSSITYKIWSGSFTVANPDTLNYGVWLPSASVGNNAVGIDLLFSDNTLMSATALTDQNGVSASPATNLANYAKNQWYTRNITLTGLNGKTITAVYVTFGATTAGTYGAYFKNIYLGSQSGSPFFATNATTTNVSPITLVSSLGYAGVLTTSSVVQVYDPAASSRISPAHSIDAVKLLRYSTVVWNAALPTSAAFNLSVSYDGGTTYTPCTNNSSLPALPAGSNIASTTLTLQETFSPGDDPSAIPSLINVAITLTSAPNATKSDIVTAFATQSAWNTGSHSSTQALSNGDLTLVGSTRNWNDNLITSQTLFTNGGSITQAATNGQYQLTIPVSTSVTEMALSRLDFAGTLGDFLLDVDVTIPSTYGASSMLLIAYRQTYWAATPPLDRGTGGYTLGVGQTGSGVGTFVVKGTNSSTDTVTGVSSNAAVGATHIRISCVGNHHQIYINNSATPLLDFTDSAYSSGQIALGGYITFQNPGGGGTGTFIFDNFAVSAFSGTWTGPSTSISSLGTCGPSVIAWTQATPTDVVQTSVDGGSTFQTCTNGAAIPNLPSGTNVSGKTVIVKASLYLAAQTIQPVLRQLFWRVLGQFPTVTGTRTTAPLGNDMSITRTVGSGWGNAFDGQAWTQVGTATTAVATGKETITNTTGDVHMVIGSHTAGDQESTDRVQISASTISAGLELRYTDNNNYYRLSINTTSITLTKKSVGTTSTLATQAATYATGTNYRMRFRVTGSNPVTLQGKVWLDGTLEPGVSNGVMSASSPQWTISATD